VYSSDLRLEDAAHEDNIVIMHYRTQQEAEIAHADRGYHFAGLHASQTIDAHIFAALDTGRHPSNTRWIAGRAHSRDDVAGTFELETNGAVDVCTALLFACEHLRVLFQNIGDDIRHYAAIPC
jgi:hypothetical protein